MSIGQIQMSDGLVSTHCKKIVFSAWQTYKAKKYSSNRGTEYFEKNTEITSNLAISVVNFR
jgi:hypothetical protein